jgi:hypothetical protein
MEKKPRILFYVERNLHLPFLEPIHDYLMENQLVDTAFSAPEYFEGTEDIPGWGLPEEQIKRLAIKSPFFEQPEKFKPEVTVVADACHFRIPHIKNIINVGHGMICKGCFYTDSPIVRRENLSEMILVPGPWHKRRLKKNVFIPIKTTGFIKSDQLFGPKTVSRENFCKNLSIDPNKKIILFAPTYNPELSAIPCVGEEIKKLATPDRVLLIKMHNLTDGNWKNLYSDMAAEHDNIFYLEDADYSGMLHAADLIISDVSSIYIEFILLNKPAILFDNPAKESFVHYRPEEIEYQTRNAARIVSSIQELFTAVEEELANPDSLSAIRKQYAKALDYGRDGKSSQRAAEAILDWYFGKIPANFPRTAVVFLASPDTNQNQIIADIDEIREKSGNFEPKIFLWGAEEKIKKFETRLKFKRIYSLEELLKETDLEYFVFLQAGQKAPHHFLKHMYNHFLWNDNVGAVKAISQKEIADQIMQRLTNNPHKISDPEIASFGLLTMAIGQSILAENIYSSCMMCKKSHLSDLLKTKETINQQTIIEKLSRVVTQFGQKVLLAADCMVWKIYNPE